MPNDMDYTKLDSCDMLHEMGCDAGKWATAFCQHYPEMEWDVMIGWFANAIMHSLDLERGTIINGEHAEYLLKNGLTPSGPTNR